MKHFKDSSALFDAIMQSAVDGMVIIDQRGVVLAFNRSAEKLFGYKAEEVTGQNVSMLMPSPFREGHDGYLERYIATGRRIIVGTIREVTGRRKDGFQFPLELSVSEFRSEGCIFFSGILHDITERKDDERALQEARTQLEERVRKRTEQLEHVNERLQQRLEEESRMAAELRLASKVFENAGEAILITDENARVISVNDAYVRITGFDRDQIIGRNPRIAKSGRHDKSFYKAMWDGLRESGKWSGEIWDRRDNGEIYPKWLTITVVRNEADEVSNYVGIFTDISEAKQVEERLQQLAYYDSLTNLPNRKLFSERLEHDLETALRHKKRLALMFIDLDRFKYVNDTFGHAVGDELLVEVSKRLRGCVRKADTVARLGGDEFTVILTDVGREEHAAQVAGNIITQLQKPIHVAGEELLIGASIGISLHPQDGENAETLVKHADIAMYQAKKGGRGIFKFFMEEMNAWTRHQITLEAKLKRAVERNEFTVFYQPKVDQMAGKVVGMEALVRWEHPEHGVVSPGEFIPLAEETGMIIPIGVQVLTEACHQAKRWLDAGFGSLRVAVNLSARQLSQRDEFRQTLEAVLEDTGLPPEMLEIEVTESMIMQDVDHTIKTLQGLTEMGMHLAMDDFGTGYSSLSYLKRFPIDTLKIDRSFVRDTPADPDDVAIVSAIISMARSLNLCVVAEGVETREQLVFLKNLGCSIIQGYHFSPPLPSDKFEDYLRKFSM
ncbi:MAG: EAL domain-containing protein [Magnetococcales bacterium]|nr:EAL domain-containing protein [Magnetococcales bacterium]